MTHSYNFRTPQLFFGSTIFASILLFFSLVFLPGEALCSSAEPSFTLDDSAKTFSLAADEITKQTGYKVKYGKELASFPITGIYQDTSISLFLRRIFKGKNYTLEMDKANKTISVACYDLAASSTAAAQSSQKKAPAKASKGHDSYTGLSLEQRKKLKQEQAKAREKARNDPQHKSAFTGMTKTQIEALKEKQQNNVDQQKNNAHYVDSFTGLTRTQFEQLQETQKKTRQEKSATKTSSYLQAHGDSSQQK